MRYWLMKSEPDEASIDHLAHAPKQTLPWTGVRNYQARNFMRDTMQVGDGVLFYHSSCPAAGHRGHRRSRRRRAYPDPTQFDPKSPYYDPKSTQETPRWLLVDVRIQEEDAARFRLPRCASMRNLRTCACSPKAIACRSRRSPKREWRFITKHLV